LKVESRKQGEIKIEIGNWEKQKDVNALSNFKFQISSFGIRFST